MGKVKTERIQIIFTSDHHTYRVGPEQLAHKTGGVWLGKPHQGQVQITRVYKDLFPETAVKRVDFGVKSGKRGKRVPRFENFPQSML